MRKHQARPRKAVSFTQFRRIQLTALQALMSYPALKRMPPEIELKCYALLQALADARYADAVQLSKAVIEQQYDDAELFRLAQQIASLVRKVPFQDPSLDPRGRAVQKFHEAEAECRATNEALRPYRLLMEGKVTGYSLAEDSSRMSQLLMRARVHVLRVLGDEPDFEAIASACRFSGGSVQKCAGSSTHLAAKLLSKEWTCTPGCLPYAAAFMAANPYMWEALFGFPHHHAGIREFEAALWNKVAMVEYDQIDFVPKTAEVLRTIGKQASLNAYVQNGVGDVLRELLKERAGIDIRTAQEEVNGPLAYLGSSCEGHPFATLDLQAASDTISIEWCKLLLPPSWFSFLDAIRSPGYTLDGVSARYNKFVAMGNGFCFPLETLLFWSLVQAVYDLNVVPDRTCAVYGDDIIVYQCAALELTELLNVSGFTLNPDKSFVFGPFRESCGQDFFGGVNVRPFVLDEIIEDHGQLFHMINSLAARGHTVVSRELYQFVPPHRFFVRRSRGPSNTAIEVPQDVFLASKHIRWNRETQSFEAKALITVPILDETAYDLARVGMYSALAGLTASETGDPSFALRFATRTFTRWEAADPVASEIHDKHWEVPSRTVQSARTARRFKDLRGR